MTRLPYNSGFTSLRAQSPLPSLPGAKPAASESAAQLDLDLVRRALEGESTAFDLLVVRYQRRIASLISRYRLDAATIEDLTQEAFIKAYRGLAGFRGESSFFTWLARIALNTAKTHLTERKSRVETVSFDNEDGDFDPYAQLAGDDSTEGALASRQVAEAIDAAMAGLAPDLRAALLMREIEGKSYLQIADALAVPVNTVRSRIFRAREAIALKLRPRISVSRDRRW